MNTFIKMRTHMIFTALALSGAMSVALSQKLEAVTVTVPITIDGNPTEWDGKLNKIDKKPFDLGIQQDDTFLYLCISSQDPSFTLRLLTRGANFWLNAKGKKKKLFGIHYPIGIGRSRTHMNRQAESEETGEQGLQEKLDYLKNDLDVFGPGRDERQRIVLNETTGIQADLLLHESGFVMELRIPLHDNMEWNHAIGVRPGKPVSLGIELPVKDRSGSGRKKGAGHNGRGGMGRSGRQGRVNNWGDATMGMPRHGPIPFLEWFKIKLQDPTE